MANIINAWLLSGFIFMASALAMSNPHVLFAQDGKCDFKGYYSRKLKSKIDKTKSRIRSNLKNYAKDKSVSHLDESYMLLINSTDEIFCSLKTASEKVLETPMEDKSLKTQAQIDKLEIITIRDTESPFLCNKLYEVGKLYIHADKKKAKKCFREIISRFTSYESKDCNNQAEVALENME